jgi:signal transduction histidine kinase
VEVLLKSDQDSSFPQAFLSVRDCGPGVPQECLGQIFQPFFRVRPKPDGASQSNGNGLGLAIAWQAIRLHKGSIGASNVSPSGLAIEIWLPTALS